MTAPTGGTFGGTNVPAQYQNQILVSAQRWNISPSVLAAQIDAESGFNPNAVSAAGAVGIAQFLPETARENGIDPYNVNEAIDGMAKLDARYLKEFDSIADALAAYNAGPGAVSQYGGIPPYAETQNYVKKILAAAGSDITPGGAGLGLVEVQQTSATNPLTAIKDFFDNVTSLAFWKRTGVGAFGAFIILLGIYFMLRKEGYKVATKIEGVVK